MTARTYPAAIRRNAAALGMTPAALTAEHADALRALLPVGSTAYTRVTTVAASGMSRRMAVIVVTADGRARNVSGLVATVTGYRWNDDGTLTARGGGMDMGFAVVYALAAAIHGDGYAIAQAHL